MKIAVRMDDIAPGMDWKKFNDFKELLDEYGIKPLIGYLRTFGDISDNCRSRDG